jgi:hypothetical protein
MPERGRERECVGGWVCDVWRNEKCRRGWMEEIKARYILIEHKELYRNSNREHGVGKSKS